MRSCLVNSWFPSDSSGVMAAFRSNKAEDLSCKELASKIKELTLWFFISIVFNLIWSKLKWVVPLIKCVISVIILDEINFKVLNEMCKRYFSFIFFFGLMNISQFVLDYNQFDLITYVKRVTPTSITFPAMTLCKKNFFISYVHKKDSA